MRARPARPLRGPRKEAPRDYGGGPRMDAASGAGRPARLRALWPSLFKAHGARASCGARGMNSRRILGELRTANSYSTSSKLLSRRAFAAPARPRALAARRAGDSRWSCPPKSNSTSGGISTSSGTSTPPAARARRFQSARGYSQNLDAECVKPPRNPLSTGSGGSPRFLLSAIASGRKTGAPLPRSIPSPRTGGSRHHDGRTLPALGDPRHRPCCGGARPKGGE